MHSKLRRNRKAGPESGDTVRPEDEKLPPRQLVTYGTQHILTMYGGLIAPPLIVGEAAGLSAAELSVLITATIFVSGLATLLQTLCVPMLGARLPIVQGASFAAVYTMGTIAKSPGLGAVFGATIGAGLVGIVLSIFFGTIVRFYPAVVTGLVITVIGLTLLPSAFDWAFDEGEGSTAGAAGSGAAAIGLAALTLLI